VARTLVGSLVVCFAFAAPARAQFVKGDLYVAVWPDQIWRVEPATWNVTLFADASDGLDGVSALTFSPSAQLLCSNFHVGEVVEFDAQGNGNVLHDQSSGLSGPYGENGLAFDANDNLYVADFNLQQIRLFPAGGGASSVFADAKDGVVFPDGLAVAANGDLLVANRRAYEVLRIDSTGHAVVFDTLPEDPFSIVVRGNGDIYVACGTTPSIYRYPAGDASRRTLFRTFPANRGNPALQFSADETTLYFTSFATGNLVTIDPDTGASNEVIPSHGLPNALSIGVYGRGLVRASWSNFGNGLAGTSGIPLFTAEQDPVLGTTITLDLENSAPSATSALLFVGFQRTDLPSSWGGELLVVPSLSTPIPLAVGTNSLTGAIPADNTLAGVAVELQVLESDAGAVRGVSFTAGLELLLGH
jgi:sugar lactone lactonase YvrE